jgi:hypothetical protein
MLEHDAFSLMRSAERRPAPSPRLREAVRIIAPFQLEAIMLQLKRMIYCPIGGHINPQAFGAAHSAH